MSKQFRTWLPYQPFLLPPSPHSWLREDHLAYFILDVVEQLDLSRIEGALRAKDPRGTRPYPPAMMVGLLVYGYCKGTVSSRKLEQATWEDVGFRVLAGGLHPDHTVLSEFRRVHLTELRGLFKQVLKLCREAGLVKLGHVSLDGTKVQGNASKHKAMSYARMVEREAKLEAEIEALLKEAESADQAEDARYGRGRRGDELPAELARRESRLARLKEAKAKLEAEAATTRARELEERARAAEAAGEAESEEGDGASTRRAVCAREKAETAAQKAQDKAEAAGEPAPELSPRDPDALPEHRVQATAEGDPKPKSQRNFTDPDSRIMKGSGGFVQGYNCQAVVDDKHQIIVATGATNQGPDAEHLRPLMEEMEANCGGRPKKMSADAGYWSEDNDGYCKEKGVEAFIATGRLKHGETLPAVRGRPPKDLNARGQMQRKLRTKAGRAIYARRKAIVEPVFGSIKERLGHRRFLLRGLEKIRAEWDLMCLGHNLLKLHRASLA